MGLGDDIHDKMTLTASGRGPLSHLICDGTVTMPELHVPALDFYDVKGDIHYDDGAMTFSDVKARVYGGIVTAHGDYNVDSHVYNIYLHGRDWIAVSRPRSRGSTVWSRWMGRSTVMGM